MMRRRRVHPIANGCGTPTTPWVPDRLISNPEARRLAAYQATEFGDCCDQHDLDWYVGGVRGGILPWRVDGVWRWRFMRSNLGLSKCIRDRYVRADRKWFGWLVGPTYFAATTLLGPIFWRWRSPTGGVMPTRAQLAALRWCEPDPPEAT